MFARNRRISTFQQAERLPLPKSGRFTEDVLRERFTENVYP